MRIVPAFVASGGTNEVANVSVIEASDHVFPCPCTHGCVLTAINVIEERRTADCDVVIGSAGSIRVIKREREITHSGVYSGDLIREKRGLAKSVVFESVDVTKERKGADSIVEFGKAESAKVIREQGVRPDCGVERPIEVIKERPIPKGSVVVGSGGVRAGEAIKEERVGSNGRVPCAEEVEQHRCSADGGIGIPAIEVQRSRADSGIVKAVRQLPLRIPPKGSVEPAAA